MKKKDYLKAFSKHASKQLLEEILLMRVPKHPRSLYHKSCCYVSEEVATTPYHNPFIEMIFDVTGDAFYVFDHEHQVCHQFRRDVSHAFKRDGSIKPIYKNLQQNIRAAVADTLNRYNNTTTDTPTAVLRNGEISFDCSAGAFFNSEEMTTIEDYLPILCTPDEAIISAEAVAHIGGMNARNGGHALMLLNTYHRSKYFEKKKAEKND